MTVGELVAELSKTDQSRIVIMQKDAEGNGYSPLAGIDDSFGYTAETTWHGDVGMQALSDEDRKRGYSEEDLCGPDAKPCVVLYPVN